MSYIYYSALRPLGRGCYPDDASNPAVEVVNYHGQEEGAGGRTAWGHVVYNAPLSASEKGHYSLLDNDDISGAAELDRRAERIARGVERKGGIPSDEVYEAVRPMLSDAPELLEMSDKEIVMAMLDYYGVAVGNAA